MANILVIGIDPSVVTTRVLILQQAGYRAVPAYDWAAFEAACAAEPFDLMLLGQKLQPSMKRDVAEFAATHCPQAMVAEIYIYAPVLNVKHRASARDSDPQKFLAFVAGALQDKDGRR